jgi:hypothetical protein
MTRKLKAFGLAIVAVIALAAVVASSASATEFTSTDGNYPISFHGEQPAASRHVFTVDENKYKTECETATFAGELKAKSSTATVSTADYTNCISAGLEATVTMNGCDYLFHLPASGGEATVDLLCPAGKEVTIDAGGGACVIHIKEQLGLKHALIKNEEAGGVKDIHVTVTISGIHATLTDVFPFLCPFAGETTVTDGTYHGTVTIKGTGGRSIDIG